MFVACYTTDKQSCKVLCLKRFEDWGNAITSTDVWCDSAHPARWGSVHEEQDGTVSSVTILAQDLRAQDWAQSNFDRELISRVTQGTITSLFHRCHSKCKSRSGASAYQHQSHPYWYQITPGHFDVAVHDSRSLE